MLLTEKEAVERACCGPKMLAAFIAPTAVEEQAKAITNCIASECVAWRWRHRTVERERTDRNADDVMNTEALRTNRRVRVEPHGCGNGYDKLVIDGVGFCGLAGEPR